MIFYNRSKDVWDVLCFWNMELVNIEDNTDIVDITGLEEMVAYGAWPFFQEAYEHCYRRESIYNRRLVFEMKN